MRVMANSASPPIVTKTTHNFNFSLPNFVTFQTVLRYNRATGVMKPNQPRRAMLSVWLGPLNATVRKYNIREEHDGPGCEN